MRITRKLNPDIAYLKNKLTRNQYHYQQYPQTEQFNEKRIESIPINQKPLLLQKIQPVNGDIIKVQLSKNNIPHQKIYSTKTTNVKSLYSNDVIHMSPNNNENNLKNFSRRLSNNEQLMETNLDKKQENNIDLGNMERLKKYLVPRYSQNISMQNLKRRGVISTSPNVQNAYPYEEKNQQDNNSKNKKESHKIRELLSQKFTYNKPKTTSGASNLSSNKNNYRRHIYDTKTYYNPNMKNIDNISVNSFNSNNSSNILVRKTGSNFNKSLQLDDLILYDERLNDILTALSNKNDVNDIEAFNECAEFFVFYFHSSLQNKLDSFFNKRNKILIVSANNMILLNIIIVYHLSLDTNLLKNTIEIVLNTLSLIKNIFYLMVKMIELFYVDSYVIKNDFYFRAFNYYLKKQNLSNFKEDDIVAKIDSTCRIMAGYIQKILKIYRDANNIYYADFNAIFNNISVLTEKELHDFFYGRIYEKCKKNISKSKSNNDYNNYYYSDSNLIKNTNNKSKYNIDNSDLISVISNKSSHYYGKINFNNSKILKMINEYHKTKVEPPFIKIPNNKKYSLVLDLDETLMNLELKDITTNKYMLHLRPGLYSFLSNIKPYYELMTFTSASKEYAMPIINEIESKEKFFDYNFFREHSVIVGNDFVKDISRIGRDMKKIIIIDNIEENFRLNKKNGIKIAPFYGQNMNDKVLYELKKILIMIARKNYDDLTIALKDFAYDIKKFISLE